MTKKELKKIKRTFNIMLIIIIILTLTVILLIIANSDKKNDNEIEWVSYKVKQRDTLWDIAEENCNLTEDVRITVFRITEYNNISAGEIQPGDIIYIPVVK